MLACGASSTRAVDQIRTEQETLTGEVKSSGPEAIVVTVRGQDKEAATGGIVTVSFGDEPATVRNARADFTAGRLEEVLADAEALAAASDRRPHVAADAAYMAAAAAAELALQGFGDAASAAFALDGFLDKFGDSWRKWPATELRGRLALAAGDAQTANARFAELAQSSQPKYRALAAVRGGEAALLGGNATAAAQRFRQARQLSEAAQDERLALQARLGEATAAAAGGSHQAAVQVIETVIAEIPAEQNLLHARAYNALGDAYAGSNAPEDAALAYLHVDLLYFQDPEQHRRALLGLQDVWRELGRNDRAADVQQRLRRYDN